MPRKLMFTQDRIIQAALDIVREGGTAALTARALGARLGTSSKPIFSVFNSMEEVQAAVLAAADSLYHSYLKTDIQSGTYPPYKASGMAYIRFAKEEKELFKLLFMRDRSKEAIPEQPEGLAELLALVKDSTGLEGGDGYLFHLEMWVYVHGIATMIATAYLDWDMAFIDRALTDAYRGLYDRYQGGKA